MKFESAAIGMIFSLTIACLVLAACWPAFGPAWHMDTGIGEVLMSVMGRTTLALASFVVLVLGLLSLRKRQSLIGVGRLFLASAPLVIAVLPISILSIEDGSLRHHDPVSLAQDGSGLSEEFETSRPVPVILTKLLGRGENWSGLIRVNEQLHALKDRDVQFDASALEQLEAELETKRSSLRPETFDCVLPRDLRQEEATLRGCEERWQRTRDFNAPIRQEIVRIEGQVEIMRLAELSDTDASVLHERLERLQSELETRRDVYIWSKLGITFAALALVLSCVFLGLGWAGLAVVPIIAIAQWIDPSAFASAGLNPTFATSLFAWSGVVSFLSVLLAVTAFRHFCSDNRTFWRDAKLNALLPCFARAFVFWIPLGLVVAGATIFSRSVNTAIFDLVYDITIDEAVAADLAPDVDACEESLRLIAEQLPDCVRRPESDIEASVAHWFVEAEQAMLREVDTLQVASDEGTEAAAEIVLAGFDRAIPDYLRTEDIAPPPPASTGVSAAFNHGRCKWYQIPCRLVRAGKYGANRAYVSQRAEYRGRLQAKLGEIAAKGGATSSDIADAAHSFIPQAMVGLKGAVSKQVWSFFRIGDVLAAVGQAVAVIAILKSFGFVLARVTLGRKHELPALSLGQAPLNGEAQSARQGVRVGDQNGLRLVHSTRYRVVLGTHINGAAPKGLIPFQPFAQLGKRLFPQRHLFQYFDVSENKSVDIPSGNVRRVIEVTLTKGQRIGFFPRYLIGISGTPRLTSRWTFDLAFFLTGRCRQCFAEGDGTLYFLSDDAPSVLEQGDEQGAINPNRLMAWTDGLLFDGEIETDFLGIYTSAAHLAPNSQGFAIFDGPNGRNRMGGAIGFVPLLLTPL